MIDIAINSVSNDLNEFLKVKFKLNEDRVVISNLTNPDGSFALKDENKIVVSLVGIQHEKLATPKTGTSIPQGSKEPIYLNLYVLFSAAFNDRLTLEALKFISAVISFFQSKKVFTPQNCGGLDSSIEKLVFDIFNQTFQEQSNMWTYMGSKYLPSILYKVRMVMIDEGLMDYEVGEVEGLIPKIGGK